MDYFYRLYASSVTGRRTDGLFTQDPIEGFEINMVYERSKVIDILNAYFKAMGLKLVIEYGDMDELDVQYDDDGFKMPKYIKNMFKGD